MSTLEILDLDTKNGENGSCSEISPLVFSSEIATTKRVTLDQLMIETIIEDNKLGES